MKITCVGGGPGGLYFALAAKALDPSHDVTVVERRPAGTTYGWGIVYWDDLLDGVRGVDPETAQLIRAGSVEWAGQRVVVADHRPVHLGGTGYGMSRQSLLDVLTRRARDLGVRIEFDREVTDLADLGGSDLVVLSDGVNSRFRRDRPAAFGTSETPGRNKHIWLRSTVPFADFTFAFEQTDAGWIWFHGYSFGTAASTVIVECTEETWRALGFDSLDGDACLEELSRIFARQLAGHALHSRSDSSVAAQWVTFHTVRNAHWHDGNAVLLGDSAHTAHFSIGSGTRMAFEDAAALARAVASRAPADLPAALQGYEDLRRPAVTALQEAAVRSAAWFEDVDRHMSLAPIDLGLALRMRRDLDDGAVPRRSPLYGLHLLTQTRLGRTARRALSTRRRAAKRRRTEPAEAATPTARATPSTVGN